MADNTASYSLKSYFGGSDTPEYKSYKEGQKSGQWADFNDYLAKKGGTNTTGSNSSTIQNAINMAQQAVQPAVQTMQAEAEPLKARYDNLIKSLQGQQQTETNRQTVTTQNELGRRGIQGGGLADQTLTNALNPITERYSGQIADTGLQGNQALASLASQIAQLQSSAGLTGLSQGYGNQQFNQSQQLQQQQLANQIAQQKADQEYRNLIYRTIQLPESQYGINKPYYKEATGSGGGIWE